MGRAAHLHPDAAVGQHDVRHRARSPATIRQRDGEVRRALGGSQDEKERRIDRWRDRELKRLRTRGLVHLVRLRARGGRRVRKVELKGRKGRRRREQPVVRQAQSGRVRSQLGLNRSRRVCATTAVIVDALAGDPWDDCAPRESRDAPAVEQGVDRDLNDVLRQGARGMRQAQNKGRCRKRHFPVHRWSRLSTRGLRIIGRQYTAGAERRALPAHQTNGQSFPARSTQ